MTARDSSTRPAGGVQIKFGAAVAYPKAGQLDTDLNRDVLWKRLLKSDVQGVRQIALDSVWSAMRFRPAK